MIIKCAQRGSYKKNFTGNYKDYDLKKREECLCLLECFAIIGIFSYFFYRSFLPVISFVIVYPFYRKWKKKKMAEKRMKEMAFQFKEMLELLLSAITTGCSLENAVLEVCHDMRELYGKNSDTVKELMIIKKGILNNQPVEELFVSWGVRSSIEDISQFAGVIAIGKLHGGNMNEIMVDAISTIGEKISLEKEIYTMLQAKRYELRIMEAVPFVIIYYIEITSKNYFRNMYHTAAGLFIMTVCLILYILAVFWGMKIMQIQI